MAEGYAAVDRELPVLGAAVRERLPELTAEIWQALTGRMPELRGDDLYEKLLDASIAENVETLLNVFQHGTAIEDVHAPAAAHEYARSLAQREIPIVALFRTYRLALGLFLVRCTDEIAGRSYDSATTAGLGARVLALSFDYIDRVSEEVIHTYQRERDNWLLAQVAGRAARVRALLADNPVDLGEAEAALGYRLRGQHIGVVAWISGEHVGDAGLAQLEHMAAAAGRVIRGGGRPLFVPRDEGRAWIWLTVPGDAKITRDLLEVAFEDGGNSARVAVGEPAVGLDGFRLTHDQAIHTQRLALVAKPGTRLTTFAEVGALALICSDSAAARRWVLATLNELAIDDQPHARLRETLMLYLTTGSYTVTAERMMLHKNTAQYRVGKAEEALGQPVGERRADVELALRACHYLGRAVLRKPVS